MLLSFHVYLGWFNLKADWKFICSASVFGVSTESMQCSYDSRGNSVPTILLMMQRRLYEQGGLQVCCLGSPFTLISFLQCLVVLFWSDSYVFTLQAEGIFRINAENTQEELVRDQLNSGIVPNGIDVHCLSGLIKVWFFVSCILFDSSNYIGHTGSLN
jgi:hypothetical protein